MRKILIGLLTVLILVSCLCASACTFKRRGDPDATEQGPYVIRYFFENDDGEFEHDASYDEEKTDSVGRTISMKASDAPEFEGYVFYANYKKNRLFDVVSLEFDAHLDLYYIKASGSAHDPDGDIANKGSYKVEYYFENASGEFVHDASKDELRNKEAGETVSLTPATIDYYDFDSQNQNNVLSATIIKDTTQTLKVYYVRKYYSITVTGGTVSNQTAKWGTNVELTPTGETLSWVILSGVGSVLSGNILTVGKENVSVKGVNAVVPYIDNQNYLRGDAFEYSSQINVTNPTVMQGVITLYNEEETLNYWGAQDSYYLFATKDDKAIFYLYLGTDLIKIKEVSITAVSVGNHTYTVKTIDKTVDGEGNELTPNYVKCYLDGTEVLSLSESDFTAKGVATLEVAGRTGTYNEAGSVASVSNNIVSGGMTLAEIKDHIYTVAGGTPANYYVFNTKDLIIENLKERVPFAGIYGFEAKANEFRNSVYACTSIEELVSVAHGNGSYKLEALKAFTLSTFGTFIKLYNDCLLMPLVSSSQLTVPGTEVIMYADVYSRDTRWWVPSAYMLYSTWPAPNNLGVMDMLEKEVAETNDYNALLGMSDKYICDVVRALSFKGAEYYYWHEYLKDPNSVFNMWWYLYSYAGTNGKVIEYDQEGNLIPPENAREFAYCGSVFNNYIWPTEGFRLPGAFFDSANSGFENNPYEIMSNYTWILSDQTKKDVTYNVYLNALGGTVDGGDTLQGTTFAELTLPTPTKSGYEFGGWFNNRTFAGTAISNIAARTNGKDLYLFAKWIQSGQDENLAVKPASIFGENMVIQRNKPVNIFGTGIDGTTVTVNFAGSEKTAKISGGKWSVTFAAMEGSTIEESTGLFTQYTLNISGGGITYNFTGVMIGEVWLGAGQSNMQMCLSWMNGTGVNYVGEYGYYDNFNKIRMFRQKITNTAFDVDENNSDKWVIAECPNEALAQSAYMISFALNLQKKLNVPVGVIISAQGATYIEEWLSRESIASAGSVLTGATQDASGNPLNPEAITSQHYYGMTELLRGIKVSGVIWYQGENNAYAENHPELYPNVTKIYDKQLVALHDQYKDIFGDSKIPLIVTELAPYAWDKYCDFRLVQRATVDANANMYLLSTVDIGQDIDIHPVYKNELGRRACNIALEFVYPSSGVTDSLSYYPISATGSNGTTTLRFDSGKTITAKTALIGFKVETTDGQMVDATATVSGNTVVLTYTGTAKNVFYMYEKASTDPEWMHYYVGMPGLYGGNDLPVAPFKIAVS